MNILVVDQTDLFPDLLKKDMVEDKKWNIITCSSGLVTLQLIEKFTPDMLIMDLNLPDIDSLEMLHKLNNFSQDIYTLVLIDKLEYGKLEQALLVGIDDYLVKPIEQKEMIARIKKAVWSSSRRGPARTSTEPAVAAWQTTGEEMPGVNHIIIYPNTSSKRPEARPEDVETGTDSADDTPFKKEAAAAAAEIYPGSIRYKKSDMPAKSAATYTFGLVKPDSSGAPPAKTASLYSAGSGERRGSETVLARAEPEKLRTYLNEEKSGLLRQRAIVVQDNHHIRQGMESGTGETADQSANAGHAPFKKKLSDFTAEPKDRGSRHEEGGPAAVSQSAYSFGKRFVSGGEALPLNTEPEWSGRTVSKEAVAGSIQAVKPAIQLKVNDLPAFDRETKRTAFASEDTGFAAAQKEVAAFTAEAKPEAACYDESDRASGSDSPYSFGFEQADGFAKMETRTAAFRSRKTARSSRGGKERHKKLLPAAKIIGNIFFAGLMVMMLTLAFFLVQSRMAGGPPSVFGYQMYVVLSGSMNPAFNTGSLALIRPLDPESVAVGDIITFKSSRSANTLTTHRVVDIERDDGLNFVTRGDANRVNDPSPVPAENLVGRVHGAIPYLGYLLGFAQTRNGLVVLVVISGLLIIILELRNLFRYAVEKQKKKEMQKAGNLYTGRVVDHQ